MPFHYRVIIGSNYISQCHSFREEGSHVDRPRSCHPWGCKKKKLNGKMHEEEDGSGESSCTASRLQSFKSLDVAEVEGAKEQASKLCGYLNKLSGKGPLRGYKLRWFVYDPRKCYLYYFKTPQDALPLGHIDIGDACFMYDVEGEEGQFEIRTAGKEFLLKQKRWEYNNTRGTMKRDSWSSPTLAYPPAGLVGKDNGLNRFDLPLRNSMSNLRPGRAENRRSVFYTTNSSSEEWEMVDAPPKDFPEQKHHLDTHRHSFGSAFSFDFVRNRHRPQRLLFRDVRGPAKVGRGMERRGSDSPTGECNGSKPLDMQLRLQNQQDELNQMQQEQIKLREELASQKELVRLLQQTLRSSQYERPTVCRAAADPSATPDQSPSPVVTQEDVAQLEALLQERDGQIQALCGHMERLSLEKESLQQELKGLKAKVGEINDQLGMLVETIQAKDQVIVKLSQENSEQSGNLIDTASPPPQQELNILKDSLQGYKSQNKFLNKEILELTVLRRNAETREKTLETKCTALEAKLCQVESKYLVLLQEVRTPVCSSEQNPAREVISRLLEDALQAESPDQNEHQIFKPNTVSEYDVYGFKTVPEEEEEEERLVAKVRALELKSLSMTDQEVSVGVKWENFLASTMNRDLVRSPELKTLIRCGVPHEHRSNVWRWCVTFHVKKFRDHLAPDYYETLLNVARDRPNPASKQIELDLLRTLPNNKHYASPSAGGIHKLRNVLVAFSWRNPDIGYCQGLNRPRRCLLDSRSHRRGLHAKRLLHKNSAWLSGKEAYLYFTTEIRHASDDLMSEKLPRLHAHFEHHKVDFSLITFNWFLVVFVDSVVSDILFKIWDAFLFEGPKIIFRFALALFKHKEEEFLKLQDSTTIFKYLRYFTRTILDSRSGDSDIWRVLHCSEQREADEHCFCGNEPVPHEANPEPPFFPPGKGSPGADGAGGNQTDVPEGEGDESGSTELRQRR
ncbi:hypothetical protein XENOCAPTIV_019218 [Xenoophorus captivus]|uniref:Rab-GAP TBC domain-containing protein n=1 Tax=Xenoophorus captivus TaxID=1517983 RepID=A0ABV0QD74_9TELE